MDDAGRYYTEEEMRVDSIIIPQSDVRQNVNKFEYYGYSFDQYTYADYQDAEEAFESVIAVNTGAGAWPHDELDVRILEDVREKKGAFGKNGIIDVPDDVGGYPVYRDTYDRVIDSDGDGIPDTWEIKHGLDPNDPVDGNYVNSVGYTALEAYLNDLVGESVGDYIFTEPVNNIEVYEVGAAHLVLVNTLIDTELLIPDNEGLNEGAIYNTNGIRMMNVNLKNSGSVYVEHLSPGHYILVVSSDSGQVKTARFIKK